MWRKKTKHPTRFTLVEKAPILGEGCHPQISEANSAQQLALPWVGLMQLQLSTPSPFLDADEAAPLAGHGEMYRGVSLGPPTTTYPIFSP